MRLRILAWLRDAELERRLARCADRTAVAVEHPSRASDFRAGLDGLDTGVALVRGGALDRATRSSLERWLCLPAAAPSPAGPEPSSVAVGPVARAVLQLGGAPVVADASCLLLPARPSEALLTSSLRFLAAALHGLTDARRRAEGLASTLALTRQLAERHDFGDILFTAARRLADVVRVARASILLADEAAGEIRVVATSDDPSIHDLKLELDRYPEVREALLGCSPVYVADVSTDPRLALARRLFGTPRATANYLFPVANERDEAFGMLLLKTAAQERLDDEQVAACQAVATACAPALQSARAIRLLERQARGSAQERLRAEREVHALSKYAQFFESAADGLIVIDRAGAVLYANPSAAALLHGESGVPGSLADALDDAGRAAFAGLLEGFAADRFPKLDLALPRPGAAPRVVQISTSPVQNGAGATLLSVRDVTEDRAMAAELHRIKTFLERVVDSSVDGIAAADMRGTIILFNRGAERITGWRAPEVVGRMHIGTLYGSQEDARTIMGRLRSPDHGGVGRLIQSRVRLRGRDGEDIPVAVSASIIYEGESEVATCGIFTDLRERMRIEERLAQVQEKLLLSEKQAIVSEISGAMAHELNQPLTSVMGYAELLRKTVGDDGRVRGYVETILQETERMAELVKKIGNLSRYETKRYVGGAQILDLDRSAGDQGRNAK
ncbi:MAG: PAS domain S-box protein [Deltaproteobacteria bacterium]|nr:PAS domain S-box protein [Deltaproteobacteria bacterium]